MLALVKPTERVQSDFDSFLHGSSRRRWRLSVDICQPRNEDPWTADSLKSLLNRLRR